jgi:hypothetical protein
MPAMSSTPIIFAVSRSVWLSLLALAIMGAADTISFVNASGQIGELESGLTAALRDMETLEPAAHYRK